MRQNKVLSIPNIITFIRIVIIPVFVTALIYKRIDYALFLFIGAAVSDMLDGVLARVTDQQTLLGAFLDPLADKFLLMTSFIMFSVYGWIPRWIAVTVISRDLIVMMGWVLLYLLYDITKVEPSFTGKAAIAAQLVFIAYTLLSLTVPGFQLPQIWMLVAVSVLTIVSGLQYIYRGMRQASEK
ncbi:MAG: CDP-alcohol phosphatidyltransferase family protein [Nitrospirae bacterium]|nr:CDP-alcohol phosphatidyltransferase family protein [Nitrospirota bacterium]